MEYIVLSFWQQCHWILAEAKMSRRRRRQGYGICGRPPIGL